MKLKIKEIKYNNGSCKYIIVKKFLWLFYKKYNITTIKYIANYITDDIGIYIKYHNHIVFDYLNECKNVLKHLEQGTLKYKGIKIIPIIYNTRSKNELIYYMPKFCNICDDYNYDMFYNITMGTLNECIKKIDTYEETEYKSKIISSKILNNI